MEVTSELRPFECLEVNTLSEGQVNEGGGVVALENQQTIFSHEKEKIDSHKGIKSLLENGRKRQEELIEGKGIVVAGIFDADGDRSYTLVYNPFDDSSIILNGDSCIVLQANFLSMAGELDSKKIAALTIESNMGAEKYLAKLGFKVIITPVGDKWILEKPKLYNEDFLIGGEESGHTIVRSLLTDSSGFVRHAYIGDGYKSFVNTVASLVAIKRTKGVEDFYNFLKLPFEREYKSTYSIFYVKKENLLEDSQVRKLVVDSLEESILACSPSDLVLNWKNFKNGEDIVFVNLLDSNKSIIGTIYIRNSGTEDKTSLVMKADAETQDLMKKIFHSFFPSMFSFLKNKSNSFCIVEKKFIQMINEGIFSEEAILKKIDQSIIELIDLKQIYKNAISGGLVVLKKGEYFLTELGESFLEKFDV